MVPKRLAKNITNIYGSKGQQWLHNLQNILHKYEKKWDLQLGDCYINAGFNYVAPAKIMNESEAVLKCGVPGLEFSAELAALRHFNAVGAVRVLRTVEEEGVMLLEKISPGILLEESCNELNEDQVVAYSVQLINKLHKPLNENESQFFVTLPYLFQGFNCLYKYFNGSTGPFPSQLIDKANSISRELLESMAAPVLLHGDLHYANILCSGENDWKAIDPKGIIGEREYEIPFPRLNQQHNKKFLSRHLDRYIEYSGFDRQRIVGWIFAKTVLAAWWMFEDSGVIGYKFLRNAKIFEKML